jgi:hypothetical protein
MTADHAVRRKRKMRTKKTVLSAVILCCVLTVAAFVRYSADPAAVVVQLTGSVQVQRAGESAAKPVAVGAGLNVGDKVIVASGAKAVLMYKTGKMEPATATFTIAEQESRAPAGRFQQVVGTVAALSTTNAKLQPNVTGMIRPVPGEPIPVAPRNGIKVLDVRPTFSWFKVPAATGYILQLRRIGPTPGRPERFQVGKDTTWTYPASAAPLIPGAEYEWTVGIAGGRIASVQQRFKVVTGEEFSQIATTLRELITAGIDPSTDGLFVLALAYRDAGLWYDANNAIERLAANGSGKGRVFYLLRGEVLDAIGDLERASKSFALADAEPATE